MIDVDDGYIVEPRRAGEREPAPPSPTGNILIDAVPPARRPQPVPIVRILMPIVMVAAMVAMVAVMFLGGRSASPVMLAVPLMMGLSMLMMFAPPQSEGDVDEVRRTYLRHLGQVREKALANGYKQRMHAVHRHPLPQDLVFRVGTDRMWERSAADKDACEVRVGVGTVRLTTPVDVRESGAAEDLEPVCAMSVRRILNSVSVVPEMPMVLNLKAFGLFAVSGPRARGLVRAVVAQLVVALGPESLGLSVQGRGWEWTRWLPHCADPAAADVRIVLLDDQGTAFEEYLTNDAWDVVIAIADGADQHSLMTRGMEEGLAVVVDEDVTAVSEDGPECLGRADYLSVKEAALLARAMTPYRRPRTVTAQRAGDLLALLGIDGADAVTPDQLWRGSLGTQRRLVVPIGVTESQSPLNLDLKEAAHGGMGPHGLCIGATGSGKSELLRTLVTALAATHSPRDLNLVLVDFKGGATFLGCESLPHTAAVITNLQDEAVLVERMHDALSGELNRRQEVLRKAGNYANITEYNAAEATPLPSLVIIVDEFSELLGQHPDFADLFVAIGRLGRSLGVHLLLASQRLEEGKLRGLDSHLSYRIGLKTFSAGESRQVLGVPDAYHLPSRPGSGYLRTDSEKLTRFQAAYVSGPVSRRVRREDATSPDGPRGVEEFRGIVVDAPGDADAEYVTDASTTLLRVVVDAARDAARVRGLKAHCVWLDPLPERVELSAVATEGAAALSATIGMIDRPYHQRQDPYTLDLTTRGGHVAVCGSPQTGKSMALVTLVGALALSTTTSQLRVYLIDLGGGFLATLTRLPHVAGYAGRGETEKIRRIVDEVAGFVTSGQDGHTLLVIDGWHAIAAAGSDLEALVDQVTALAADGPAAGVHLAIATPRWTTLRPAIRDLLGHRIELRVGDPMDSIVNRKAQAAVPVSPGRGVTTEGEQMLVAFTSAQDIEHLRVRAENLGQHPVPRLKLLPTSLSLASLEPAPTTPAGAVVFGVGGPMLQPGYWHPEVDSHLVIVGAAESGKSTAVAAVLAGLSTRDRADVRLVVVDVRRAHLGRVGDELLAAYAASTAAAEDALRDTVITLRQRLPGAELDAAALASRSWWSGPELFVVIDDLELVPETQLRELAELLPHARDIGLHVVVARKSGGVARALYSGFLAALRDTQPAALVLSAEREDGPVFGVTTSLQPPGRARFVIRGEDRGLYQIAQV
ncbi:type VII secretion protein EccCa [Corynebacterium uterequi]|uniref:Type VII secretion protein EccCa/type VII secretion protein EccCb n=1 Tax=Corynebacterium uterequi TaxID=1072256 RepID=A0A0G3HGY9_9CORY|nr:type VII secretion protein EccCa [Corynebacterium uterequi]AKK10412.1 type VII secretion protein EccCa/type VII secretion protein EccCb [Corynebacterium uterequi]